MLITKIKGTIALAAASVLVLGTAGAVSQIAYADDAASSLEGLTSIKGYSVIDKNGKTMMDGANQYQYNGGNPVCPFQRLVNDNNEELSRGQFIVYYYNNRAKGTATLLLRGNHMQGYKDFIRCRYKITKEPTGWQSTPSGFAVSLIPDQIWNMGTAITPQFSVKNRQNKILRNGVDYTASFSNNKSVGTAKLTIKGKGTYKKYSVSTTFKIRKLDLSKCSISAYSAAYSDGQPVTTSPTVTYGGKVLPQSGNYTVSYSDNVEPGKGKLTVAALAGSKNVSGSKTAQFDITVPLSSSDINVTPIADQLWTGQEVKPTDFTVSYGTMPLRLGVDYEISGYNNNTDAGKANVVLRGKGKFSGTRAEDFYVKYKFANPPIRVSYYNSTLTYTGGALTPTVIVTDPSRSSSLNTPLQLNYGKDYTIRWETRGNGASLSESGLPQERGTYIAYARGCGDYYMNTEIPATDGNGNPMLLTIQ